MTCLRGGVRTGRILDSAMHSSETEQFDTLNDVLWYFSPRDGRGGIPHALPRHRVISSSRILGGWWWGTHQFDVSASATDHPVRRTVFAAVSRRATPRWIARRLGGGGGGHICDLVLLTADHGLLVHAEQLSTRPLHCIAATPMDKCLDPVSPSYHFRRVSDST